LIFFLKIDFDKNGKDEFPIKEGENPVFDQNEFIFS